MPNLCKANNKNKPHVNLPPLHFSSHIPRSLMMISLVKGNDSCKINNTVGLIILVHLLAAFKIFFGPFPFLTANTISSDMTIQNFGKVAASDDIESTLRASLSENCTDIVLATCPFGDLESQCDSHQMNSTATYTALQRRKIPKIVWQTWKSKQLPSCQFEMNRRKLRLQNPEWEFRIVDDKEASTFMDVFFPGKVADAFHSISPTFGAARADLLRYCLLYIFGGVYLDLDSSLNCPLDDWICDDDTAVISHETNFFPRPEHHPHMQSMYELMAAFNKSTPQQQITPRPQGLKDHTILQWMLVFAPKHIFLKKVIELVADRVLQWQDDVSSDSVQSSICPHIKTIVLTGPIAYTTAIWDVLVSSEEAKQEGQKIQGKQGGKEKNDDKEVEQGLEHVYRFLGFDYEGYATYKIKNSHEKEPEGTHYGQLRWTEPFKVMVKSTPIG